MNKNIFMNIWKNFLNEDLNIRDNDILQNLSDNLKIIKNEILDPEYSNWHQGNEKRKDLYFEFGMTVYYLSDFNEESSYEPLDLIQRDREYYLNKYGIDSLNLEFIAEGSERFGFNVKNVDNVVLKVSIDKSGTQSIKKELDVSQGEYGQGSSKLFTKVYLYDLDADPFWIILEKLQIIHDMDEEEVPFFSENLKENQIRQIFPTLTTIFKLDDTEKFVRSCDDFLKYLIEFVEEKYKFKPIPTNVVEYDFLKDLINNIKDSVIIDYINPKNSMTNNLNPNVMNDLLNLNGKFEDLNYLINNTKENLYHDFSLSNLGVDRSDIRNDNLSPKSIKILDLSYKHPVYDKKVYRNY